MLELLKSNQEIYDQSTLKTIFCSNASFDARKLSISDGIPLISEMNDTESRVKILITKLLLQINYISVMVRMIAHLG